MPFPQAPTGARWILSGWRWSGWLWCCGRSCWWCSRRMTKRSSPVNSGRGEEGAWRTWLAWGSLSSQSRSSLPGACRTYTSRPPSHMHSQLCVTPRSLAIYRIGGWGVSSMIAWTFSTNSLVRVSWWCPSVSPPPKGRPMRWAVPLSVEPSGFAFWGCWLWSCCHNLDR